MSTVPSPFVFERWGLTICPGGLVWSAPAAAANPLPSFVVDLAESSVSGSSSGALEASGDSLEIIDGFCSDYRRLPDAGK